MVETVKENFQKVIVVLNIGGMFDTSWFVEDDQIQAMKLAEKYVGKDYKVLLMPQGSLTVPVLKK